MALDEATIKLYKMFRDAAKEKLSGMMDLIGYPTQVLNSTWLNQRYFNDKMIFRHSKREWKVIRVTVTRH